MWPSLQETVDLVTFTEEILNGKLYFMCSNTFKWTDYLTEMSITLKQLPASRFWKVFVKIFQFWCYENTKFLHSASHNNLKAFALAIETCDKNKNLFNKGAYSLKLYFLRILGNVSKHLQLIGSSMLTKKN